MKSIVKAHKLNKKAILIISTVFSFLFLFVIPQRFQCGLTEMLTDAICSAIAFLIRAIAGGIDKILSDMGCSIQSLVYNIKDGGFDNPTILTDMNLSLLRGTTLSTKLFQVYDIFVYIAASFLGTIGLWMTFDFIKTANDVNHKKILKERLTKLIISIVLLLSIPTLFDILMIFNQTLVDIFRMFIADSIKPSDVSGSYLSNVFKELAESDKSSVVYACIYLISSFLNIWLAIFYMIRDITISFLFILAPIIVILLPYRTDLIVNWLKEMCSNIFTQAIQALVFAVLVAITQAIDGGTLYDKIFALVSFAMFIPITATVKKVLGLEGQIGAAKSNAGLGATVGALSLGAAVVSGVKAKIGKGKDLVNDIGNLSAESDLLKKSSYEKNAGSIVSTGSPMSSVGMGIGAGVGGVGVINKTGGRGLGIDPDNKADTNRNQGVMTTGDYGFSGGYSATNRARQIEGLKRQAKRELAGEIVGGIGGALVGGAMALGSTAYGSPFGTVMAGKLGAEVGGGLSSAATKAGATGTFKVNEKIKDKMYGKGIRFDGSDLPALKSVFEGVEMPHSISDVKSNFEKIQSNMADNKETIQNVKNIAQKDPSFISGIDTTGMTQDEISQENEAILKRNSLERQGRFQQAHRSYARNTYDRNKNVATPLPEGINSTIGDNDKLKERILKPNQSKYSDVSTGASSMPLTDGELPLPTSSNTNVSKSSPKSMSNILKEGTDISSMYGQVQPEVSESDILSKVNNLSVPLPSNSENVSVPEIQTQAMPTMDDMDFGDIEMPDMSSINNIPMDIDTNIPEMSTQAMPTMDDMDFGNIEMPDMNSINDIPMDIDTNIPEMPTQAMPTMEDMDFGGNFDVPVDIKPNTSSHINTSNQSISKSTASIGNTLRQQTKTIRQAETIKQAQINQQQLQNKVTQISNDLNGQMNQYMNNTEYLFALESCKNDIPTMFSGNDNSQLS